MKRNTHLTSLQQRPGAQFDQGVPFEKYVGSDGLVDWTKRHVCIQIDHLGSHKQLWVLTNGTSDLHNFHIHQMKFRLATATELAENSSLTAEAFARLSSRKRRLCSAGL